MRRALVLSLLLLPVLAAAQPVDLDTHPVTVEAQGSPLTDVLSTLTEQVGGSLVFGSSDVARVTLSLKDRPFPEAMNLLADMFGLIASWNGSTLVVRTVEDAVSGADKALAQGNLQPVLQLSQEARGSELLYGSPTLREKLKTQVDQLVEQRSKEALSNGGPDPSLAAALASIPSQPSLTQASLAALAVRGYLRQGKGDDALELWANYLKGRRTWPGAVAAAELLLALHYSQSPQATEFWRQSFDLSSATTLLKEGFRQGAYRDALHLARLNLRYAKAAGRTQDADALSAAIDACLASPRRVAVTCAIDKEATSDPGWESKIRARVDQVAQAFAIPFGINFDVTRLVSWDPPSTSDFQIQNAAIKSAVGSARPELTIGFILEVFPDHPANLDLASMHLWTGFGCPHMGPYLLARDFSFEYVTTGRASEWTMSPGAVAETLIHEMGHMFGALHVDDENSVMRAVSRQDPKRNFDALNARVIQLHKWQDLSKGADSLDEPELLELVQCYRDLAAACSRPNGAQEEESRAHMALARLYRERQNPARAAEEFEQVVALGVPSDLVSEARRILTSG